MRRQLEGPVRNLDTLQECFNIMTKEYDKGKLTGPEKLWHARTKRNLAIQQQKAQTRLEKQQGGSKDRGAYAEQKAAQEKTRKDYWAGKPEFGTSMKETFRAEVAERKRINEEKKKKKAADKADKKEVKVAANNPNNA